MEAHQLGEQLFVRIKEHLAKHGLQVNYETVVDATIISAPSSTQNRTKERDPEAHFGINRQTKWIHAGAATVTNVHDSQVLPELPTAE